MTPLSDALTAAQRSALQALEKAYVAGKLDGEQMLAELQLCGFTDAVDLAFLFASLDVLKEWGVAAPNMTERVAEQRDSSDEGPATAKQIGYIDKLCGEIGAMRPDLPYTRGQASEIIDSLKAGTYDPAKWAIPF